MRLKNIYCFRNELIVLLCVFLNIEGRCQTMFTAWQHSFAKADMAYGERNFKEAVVLYQSIFEKQPSEEVNLRIARCYYFMREPVQAVLWYQKFTNVYHTLPVSDLYYCAEAYANLGNYESAIRYYELMLNQTPDDLLIAKKVWRLKNIKFLQEDSLYFRVESIGVNTKANEIGGIPFGDGLVFLSNRETNSLITKRDATTQTSFYHLYFASFIKDSLGIATEQYSKPEFVAKGYAAKFQEGPVSFFNGGKSMVYTKSADKPNADGRRTLQIYFAEWKDGKWNTTYAFPNNSSSYSVTDPAILDDGSILYFSSDMRGGQGGKDLYRCDYKNGKWSKPVNLTDLNTRYDESFPFVQNRVLYFSSTGHAGMGGIDVFKTDILENGFSDVVNLGYPINSHADDFSFVVDSLGTTGYFSSNRNGEQQDDIYRVDINVQTYPIIMEGILRYKEIGWHDSTMLRILPNTRLVLVDNVKGAVVYESNSDSLGGFVLRIPYFSQYILKVIEENKIESIVSLEVPRHRKKEEKHDIVVVRDLFNNSPEIK